MNQIKNGHSKVCVCVREGGRVTPNNFGCYAVARCRNNTDTSDSVAIFFTNPHTRKKNRPIHQSMKNSFSGRKWRGGGSRQKNGAFDLNLLNGRLN